MLVGREPERERIDALLARARVGHGSALVLRGEPGIGKTSLLAYAEESADGMWVLHARGVEAEAELAFSGLHELLRPLLDLLDAIPELQREALSGALGFGPPRDARLLVAAGALSLIAAAAEERPVLMLVDDAHWLDAESAATLVFVGRRLEHDPALLLAGAREGDPRTFDAPGLEELVLDGLTREDAGLLVAADGLPEGVLDDLYREAAGNPLALLELPSALSARQRRGEEPLAHPLPVTDAVQAAFTRRIVALPEETRRALTVAAAEPSFALSPISRACVQLGVAAAALETAEEGGLVTLCDGLIAFRHPLVRAAAYHAAPAGARRAAHRALADAALVDGEAARHAWHLAAATFEPDEQVAAALEAVADETSRRSGYATAVATFERAADLTPDPEPRARRLYRAIEAIYASAGYSAAGSRLVERALATTRDPELRSDLLLMRGVFAGMADPREGRRRLLADSSDPGDVPPETTLLLASGAAFFALRVGDADGALEAASRAREFAAGRVDDDPFVQLVLGAALLAHGRVAEAAPLLAAADAVAAGAEAAFARVSIVPRRMPEPVWWTYLCLQALLAAGRLERATRHVEAMIEWARGRGAISAWQLMFVSRADYLAGRWASARSGLLEALRSVRDLRFFWPWWAASTVLAELAAGRGADAECHAYEQEAATARAAWGSMGFVCDLGCGAGGLLALGQGRIDDAVEVYARDVLPAAGPLKLYPQVADAVEALARAGRVDAAEPLAAEFVAQATAAGWPWALARAAHLRALVAPSQDDFEDALRWHEEAGQPFPRARSELAYGAWLRRAGRRLDARPRLRAAVETFEQLGAEPWAEQARAELRATGERVPRRAGPVLPELTPQELQVALVVARGVTNREAAAQLYLSPKTVEKHLGSVYAKLGLRSRTELAAAIGSAGASTPLPASEAASPA